MQLTSFKKYHFKSLYEWFLENDLKPHIIIDKHYPNVDIPPHLRGGSEYETFNLAPNAIRHYQEDEDGISFSAMFGGKPYTLVIPYGAMLALINANNNPPIMVEIINNFLPDGLVEEGMVNTKPEPTKEETAPKARPSLSIVK